MLKYRELTPDEKASRKVIRAASGCAVLLIAGPILIGLITTYWYYIIPLALVAGAGLFLYKFTGYQHTQRILSVIDIKNRKYSGDACRLGETYGLIRSIKPDNKISPASAHVCCDLLIVKRFDFATRKSVAILDLKDNLEEFNSSKGFQRMSESEGLLVFNDLSVETKAVKSAFDCFHEYEWTSEALFKLEKLMKDVEATLDRAFDNQLLASSVPELKIAFQRITEEHQKLQKAQSKAYEYLRQLHEFLTIPPSVRPILNFDADDFYDPTAFSRLEESFSEVLLLNESFRDLCRDSLK